jgi:putative oxidoreductase
MSLALFILRLVVGLLFMGHGAQKLFGMAGGHGLAGTGTFFESAGLRPGRRHALLAGLGEFCGGLLLLLGWFTPIGAAAIIAVMVAAIWTVHGAKGLWNSDGGFEYNLVLIAAAFALAGVGAGKWSLDNAVGVSDKGTGWAIVALAIGLLAGAGAVLTGRSHAAHEREEREKREHKRPPGHPPQATPA